MSYRPYAALLLVAAAASAVVAWNPLATLVVGGSTLALLVGLQWKRVGPTLGAGWLLYLPMAVTLTRVMPPSWSYLAAGLFAVVVPERLTFEYEVSEVLRSPTGVDSEVRSRISRLSKAHWMETVKYAALALAVMAIASVASYLTSYASELITAAVLLVFLIVIYATR
jgi:hypothetical protein